MKLSGIEGKVAIVTGAGQGIGEAIALSLAEQGADVVVAELNPETGRGVADKIKAMGRRAFAIKTDVTKSSEVKQMVETALREFGKIDILVNNAGGSARERSSEFKDMPEEVWDSVIDKNLLGMLRCTKAVINHMIERRSGKIVSTASYVGVTGGLGVAEYSAAKAGIIVFSRALAKEVGRYGINVNCVSPGVTATVAVQQIPKEIIQKFIDDGVLGRLAQPRDIANMAVFLCSDEASFITGENFGVCGGMDL